MLGAGRTGSKPSGSWVILEFAEGNYGEKGGALLFPIVLMGQKEKRHKGELPIGRVARPALAFLMEEPRHLAGSQAGTAGRVVTARRASRGLGWLLELWSHSLWTGVFWLWKSAPTSIVP